MAMDGRLLIKAKKHLAAIRLENQKLHELRKAEVYKKLPQLQEIDRLLRLLVINAVGFSLRSGKDPVRAIDEVSRESLALQKERKDILISAGYPPDYIDEIYCCSICEDTGYIGCHMCDCLKTLYQEEMTAQLSNLFKLGNETFETFEFSYYSTTPDAAVGVSPQEWMMTVYETCQSYAMHFGDQSVNLLFQGKPGLGKTFLSACIARVVSARGFSVVYETVVAALDTMEREKFRKAGDSDQTAALRRFFDCDLMILDDLGTEMSSTFTSSALYTLINHRLIAGKKTVISTNLSFPELRRRYAPQLVSRLEGEYLTLTFLGEDIRQIKKAQNLS